MTNTKTDFLQGVKDAVPIALGYFAVSFSLGIIARECGFTPLQAFIASMTTYASAGQYLGFTLYAADAALIQLIIMTVITNARYLLMGFALNQRIPAGTSTVKRFLTGLSITDEIFGITIARPGQISWAYCLGALIMANPFWSLGAMAGVIMGNILPLRIVSALSVALYGMFIAVIIPPSRKDKKIGLFVIIAFTASFVFTYAPHLSSLSDGNRTIILTLAISSAAALIFPVKSEEDRDA